ncbi:TRAP transporter substrate-binding protein DctP [Algihabitans albus]|uniref:TRAP transporter substrate-binding protein DctP n=1 Tax=Algihabitans albus TaxID=2164067 RepID=UPI000E5CE6B7|nr:TRAP transporter substrate-binding protein DctP [Algihabitans albus]
MFKILRRGAAATALALAGIVAAPAVAPTTAQQAFAADEPIEMIMTNEIATSHWTAALMEDFAATIRSRSDGRIEPKIFHAGALYKDRDAVAALGTGAVHMVWPVSVQLESLAPEYGVINLPFAIDDELMLTEGAADALTDLLSGFVEDRGFRVMGLMRTADLVFLFPEKPVHTPADLEGDKVRLTGGTVLQQLMRELGASPISMPATEMAAALMQGAIDGIFTSAGGWEMVGTNAAQVATWVPGLSVLTYTVVADAKWIDNLPPDLREIVETTVAELVADQWRNGMQSDQETMEKMIAAGGELVTVDEAAVAEFRTLAERASEAFTERHPEVWDEFRQTVSAYRKD